MKTFILIILLFTFNLNVYANATAQEITALRELYNATNGDEWTRSDNWDFDNNPQPCRDNWYGVTCDGYNDVIHLRLGRNNLRGNIPSSIANLVSLKTLRLDNNHLSGVIPEGITNLRELKYIFLDFNDLSGSIPRHIGNFTKLLDFLLNDNNLNGTIPREIGGLRSATRIQFQNNQLTGAIPREIGNLAALRIQIYLDHNQLTDTIPASIKNIDFQNFNFTENCGLYSDDVSVQNLIDEHMKTRHYTYSDILDTNGNCPTPQAQKDTLEEFYTLSHGDGWRRNHLWQTSQDPCLWEGVGCDASFNIQSINLPYNNLADENLFSNNKNSNEALLLDSCANTFIAKLLIKLSSLEALQSIDLSNNDINGCLPIQISALTNLRNLNLSRNKINANIPSQISGLENLKYLDLSQNKLRGEIIDALGDMQTLEELRLSHNNFSGSIPQSITNLVNLRGLRLSFNRLSGVIPDSIRNLTLLRSLYLGHNCKLYTENEDVISFIDGILNSDSYEDITNTHNCSTINPAIIHYLLF